MTDEVIEAIRWSGLDNIYLSMDALTQGTYDKVRTGGDISQTIAGSLKLIERARKEGWTKPDIKIQFIEMDENIHEEEEFVKFWLSHDVSVKVRYKLAWGPFSGIRVLRLENFQTKRIPCSWLIRTVIMLWDGTVIQCDTDHEARFPAGNINTQSLYEVWNGELKKRRERHWAGDYNHPLCVNCNDWKCGMSRFYKPGEKLPEISREGEAS